MLNFQKQVLHAMYRRLPKSHQKIQEKYCVDSQTAAIENLLFVLNKSGQLVVVHCHAEGKINPVLNLMFS
jgi:hypothetical protein